MSASPDVAEAVSALRAAGVLTEEEAVRPGRAARGELVSVRAEIRAALYLGVLLLVSGVGLFLKENVDRIGPTAIAGAVGLAAGACLAWAWRRAAPFSWGESTSTHAAFDYVLLLGALLAGADLAWVEAQTRLLGPAWPLHLLALAFFYGALAYRFDSRMLLSLALASFAAWRGLALSVARASLGPGDVERLRAEALATGALFAAVGIVSARAGKKAHFEDVWVNAGALLVLFGLLSGVFGSPLDWGVWLFAAPRRLGGGRGGRVPLEADASVRAGRPRGDVRPDAAGLLRRRLRLRRAPPAGGDARLRRSHDDLPRPPADEDSLKGEWAAAERVEDVRAAAPGWKRAGAISSGTLEEIFRRYPEPRTLPAPLWRVLTFGLASFILLAVFGAFAITVRPNEAGAWVLCAVFGVAFVAIAELQARSPAMALRGGVEAAGFWGIALLIGALSSYSKKIFIFTNPKGRTSSSRERRSSSRSPRGAGATPPSRASRPRRVFIFLARAPHGRLLWIAGGVALSALAERFTDRPAWAPSHRRCASGLVVCGIAAVYAAVNYWSLEDHAIENLFGRTRTLPRGWPGDVPLTLSILATALVPVAVFLRGVAKRRRLFLDTGLVLLALSLLTLRLYVHDLDVRVVLVGAGALLLGGALAVNRWLRNGPDAERRGFTADPLYADESGFRAVELVPVLAAHSPQALPAEKPGFEGGGGSFGGGGAGGSSPRGARVRSSCRAIAAFLSAVLLAAPAARAAEAPSKESLAALSDPDAAARESAAVALGRPAQRPSSRSSARSRTRTGSSRARPSPRS